MFAFLGVYLRAVSAHKLISERRGVFLLHGLLSRGMWASSKANAACAPRGSVSAPLRAPLLGFLLLPGSAPALFCHQNAWQGKTQQLQQGREVWEGWSNEKGWQDPN